MFGASAHIEANLSSILQEGRELLVHVVTGPAGGASWDDFVPIAIAVAKARAIGGTETASFGKRIRNWLCQVAIHM